MFRDQSSNVIRKAKAAEAKKADSPAAHSSRSSRETTPKSEPVEDLELVSQRWDPIFSIEPTLDERATCYFVFNYLIGIQSPSRGVLDNLLLLYQTNSIDDNLLTAVKAVSYASYAHHMQSTELTDVSRYQYTKSVTMTNRALQSTADAVKDSTLMSVMILGMYEILTGNTQRSLEAWMEHIRGSAALIKMRGEDQLRTPQGRRLFIQASIGILTSCVQLNIAVPKQVEEMVRRIPEYLDTNDDFIQIAFNIHLTMIEVNQFRAAIHKGRLTDLHDILSQALEFDARLNSIADKPPPEFRYYVLRTPPNSDIAFRDTYHVYFDLLTANLWNSVRVFRILIQETIRDTLLKGFATKPPVFILPEHTLQFQRSTDVCYELGAEILYSVPQHLGYIQNTGLRDLSSPAIWSDGNLNRSTKGSFGMTVTPEIDDLFNQSAAIECSPPSEIDGFSPKNTTPPSMHELVKMPDIRASGGYNLMWPLWLAGAMDVVTEDMQLYAIKSMRRIGREMGIRQAFMLAQVIESKAEIDVRQQRERFEIVEEG